MNFKKVTAFMLAAAMAFSALTGCGSGKSEEGKGEETTKTEDVSEGSTETDSEEDETQAGDEITFPLTETMEFTSFSGMNQGFALDQTLAMQTAMENANIKINFDSVLGADLTEKRNLVMASGDYPDMLFKASVTSAELEKYGTQGILIPLEDLIKQYAPNLTKKLDEIDGWKYITSSDGHIYSLPEIDQPLGAMNTYWINKKWMDNLGLKEPTSYDELYQVLKAFKEEDANGNGDPNDEIPLMCTDVGVPELLLAYEDFSYDMGTKTAVLDGELTYIPTTEHFKDYIAYITKLYEEGIMDKNTFTQKYEQQAAIGQAGDVLGSFFDPGAFLAVGRDNDDDYIALTPFQEGTYPMGTGIATGTMAITDKCENPEVLIAWADYFYSEEGGILAWLGVEGKTYEVKEDGTWGWLVGNGYGDDIAAVRFSNTIQGTETHPSIMPDFWFKMSAEVDPDEVYLNGERSKMASKGVVPLPKMTYTEQDSKTIATLKTDIDAYIQQYVAQVVTGGEDLEKSWDTYVETMKAMGTEELISIYRAAYEKALEK